MTLNDIAAAFHHEANVLPQNTLASIEQAKRMHALADEVMATGKRLSDLIARRGELPKYCPACVDEMLFFRLEWTGETLACPNCRRDALAIEKPLDPSVESSEDSETGDNR